MSGWLHFFFAIYPYICLTVLVVGLIWRYAATPGQWNARSSQIFEHKQLRIGSMCFHYGILFSFGGHVIGLLLPAALLSFFGMTPQVHQAVAGSAGKIIAPLVILGLGILLWRRCTNRRVWVTTVIMDLVVVGFISINALTGMYQAFVAHFNALETIGPWIRSVLIFSPDLSYLESVPFFLRLHVFSGLTIFAMLPFSRLVHILSVPVTYVIHPLLMYRRRYAGL